MLCTSGFVNGVTFAHKRPGKGDLIRVCVWGPMLTA